MLIPLQVTDKGKPPLSMNATVVVVVEDQNDETPRFKSPVYTAVIPENTVTGILPPTHPQTFNRFIY